MLKATVTPSRAFFQSTKMRWIGERPHVEHMFWGKGERGNGFYGQDVWLCSVSRIYKKLRHRCCFPLHLMHFFKKNLEQYIGENKVVLNGRTLFRASENRDKWKAKLFVLLQPFRLSQSSVAKDRTSWDWTRGCQAARFPFHSNSNSFASPHLDFPILSISHPLNSNSNFFASPHLDFPQVEKYSF